MSGTPDIMDPTDTRIWALPPKRAVRCVENAAESVMNTVDRIQELMSEQGENVGYKLEFQNLMGHMKIERIFILPIEGTGTVRVEVTTTDKRSLSTNFNGPNNQLDLQTFIRAFDHIMMLIVMCDVSVALLEIKPTNLFPEGLQLANLGNRNFASRVVGIKEIQWALGAPLELFVQIRADRVIVDTSFHNNIDGLAVINDIIRQYELTPNLGGTFGRVRGNIFSST